MPCVHIDTSRLKDILAALPELPPHNWLITDLDCLDYCGWDGCEKWAKRELFLTDEEFRRDVNLRDMQMTWGIFSAIPADISKEEIYKYPLPEVESPRYMANKIVPQPPLLCLSYTPVTAATPLPAPTMQPCWSRFIDSPMTPGTRKRTIRS